VSVPQSTQDLENHLQEQLRFLVRSADAFDQGLEDESKRLATVLRVMLHDTAASRSLLGQLGRKDTPFFDTAEEIAPGNQLGYQGLVAIWSGPGGTKYAPFLDDCPSPPRTRPFEEWWNAPAFIEPKGSTMTRRQLVCAVANKDGGAHVDPKLDAVYVRLSRTNAMGWVVQDAAGQHPIEPPHLAAVRQIAHEVLKTLVPTYSKKITRDGFLVAGAVLMQGAPAGGAPPIPSQRPQRTSTKNEVGRNDPCPCGSGRKYKKCHGR
jgi:hypothetical protein